MLSSQTSPNPLPWRSAVLVFSIALIGRLLFLFGSADQSWPHSIYYEGDAPVWVEYATALNRGETFEHGIPLRTPGVAYLLHWLQPESPPFQFEWLKVLWCVMSALSCSIAYLGFTQAFGRRAALLAAGLCAFSYGSYVTATSLNNEAPYTLVLTAIVLATLRFDWRPRIGMAVVLGFLHAGAALLRAEHTLLVVLLVAVSVWKTRRLVPPVYVLGAFLLACAPWSLTIHDAMKRFNETAAPVDYASAQPPWTADAKAYLESMPAFTREDSFRYFTYVCQQAGDREVTAERVKSLYLSTFEMLPEPLHTWDLISSGGPFNFALANHKSSDGGFSKGALDSRWSPDPGFQASLPSHDRLYNHGYRVGWESIWESPGDWFRLVGKKLDRFADGVTLGLTAENLPYGRGGVRQPVDLVTPGPGRGMIWRVAFALSLVIGLLMSLARRCGGIWMLLIVYKLIVTVLFYGYARQAVSIHFAFSIFVAVALDVMVSAMERRWRAQLGLIAMGGILVAVGLAMDVHYFVLRKDRTMRISGTVKPTPQWGTGAFQTYQLIRLEPIRREAKP